MTIEIARHSVRHMWKEFNQGKEPLYVTLKIKFENFIISIALMSGLGSGPPEEEYIGLGNFDNATVKIYDGTGENDLTKEIAGCEVFDEANGETLFAVMLLIVEYNKDKRQKAEH